MKKVIFISSLLVIQNVFAATITTYNCDMREALSGNYLVGSGTRVMVNEDDQVADVQSIPTAPSAEWRTAFSLSKVSRDRYQSGSELQDFNVTFTRISVYARTGGVAEPSSTGALIYKGSNTSIYLCTKI